VIENNTPIQQGDSGGALVNQAGEVVGISNARVVGAREIAYAINIDSAMPILQQLKADPSLYVRKSVANNLNDISKTHPNLVIQLAEQWYGKNEPTNWIVKHGCRSLLKKGNKDALTIFGYNHDDGIEVKNFTLSKTTVAVGHKLSFSLTILAPKATKVRLEYGIDYVKANGKPSRKIFQISQVLLNANQQKTYSKNHSFANLTTRKHYAGTHAVTLIINGLEQGTLNFELTLAQPL
jgi:hypothetical protein